MALTYDRKTNMLKSGSLKDISEDFYHGEGEGWDEVMDFCTCVQKLLSAGVRITTTFKYLTESYVTERDAGGVKISDVYTFEAYKTMMVDRGLRVTYQPKQTKGGC